MHPGPFCCYRPSRGPRDSRSVTISTTATIRSDVTVIASPFVVVQTRRATPTAAPDLSHGSVQVGRHDRARLGEVRLRAVHIRHADLAGETGWIGDPSSSSSLGVSGVRLGVAARFRAAVWRFKLRACPSTASRTLSSAASASATRLPPTPSTSRSSAWESASRR